MSLPKISIIIPAYNVDKYIGKCINSLQQQSYKNIEIIIIDDGSSDDTWNVLQAFADKDKRIIIKRQKNLKTACARNAALELVTGAFITFVDGDDALSSDALEKNIKFLINDPQLDWVSFSVIRVNNNGERNDNHSIYRHFEIFENRVVPKNDFLKYYIKGYLSGICCGTIYRWESVKLMRFPCGEYYEDSFYFAESLWTTQKGMLSSYGQYLYLVRENSSQFAKIDEAHLRSIFNSAERKLINFKKVFKSDFVIISQIEDNFYYFFKLYAFKAVPGADKIYNEYCKKFKTPHRIRLFTEIKLLLYRIIGYDNIVFFINKVYRK